MSSPNPVCPGTTHFSTRAVHKRQFLLRPDRKLNQIVEYTVAVLAERHGIELHALCVESSHKHDVATDPDARIVDFQRELHELLTRQINAEHGEFGAMWDGGGPNRVECTTPEVILEEIVYTMTNPVKDGLVAHGKSWPGVRRSWPAKDKVIARPEGFFRDQDDGGLWPKTATLRFTRPPGYGELSDEELSAKIRGAIAAEEQRLREVARKNGKRFMGRRAVLRCSRYAYAQSWREQFGLIPRVAGATEPRIAAIERLKAFRDDHAAAYALHRTGEHGVVFPYGTWKMRVCHGARCRPPPRA